MKMETILWAWVIWLFLTCNSTKKAEPVAPEIACVQNEADASGGELPRMKLPASEEDRL